MRVNELLYNRLLKKLICKICLIKIYIYIYTNLIHLYNEFSELQSVSGTNLACKSVYVHSKISFEEN